MTKGMALHFANVAIRRLEVFITNLDIHFDGKGLQNAKDIIEETDDFAYQTALMAYKENKRK